MKNINDNKFDYKESVKEIINLKEKEIKIMEEIFKLMFLTPLRKG